MAMIVHFGSFADVVISTILLYTMYIVLSTRHPVYAGVQYTLCTRMHMCMGVRVRQCLCGIYLLYICMYVSIAIVLLGFIEKEK